MNFVKEFEMKMLYNVTVRNTSTFSVIKKNKPETQNTTITKYSGSSDVSKLLSLLFNDFTLNQGILRYVVYTINNNLNLEIW